MRRICLAALMITVLLVSVALALSPDIIWPGPGASAPLMDGSLRVDPSGAECGYLLVAGAPTDASYKLRIRHGDDQMTYVLNSSGEFETFPLQFGPGEYAVSLYERASDKKYAAAGTVSVTLQNADSNTFCLVPNQMVDYTQESTAVTLSDEICKGLSSDKEKFEAIRQYVSGHFGYDFVRTFSIGPDTLPDIDYCMEHLMGVGQDLAAMTACMLRVQGIPTRFVAGYLGNDAHAWNIVMLDGQEVLYDPSRDVGGVSGNAYAAERYY